MYCITSTQKEGSGDSCMVFVFSRGICIEPMGCKMSCDFRIMDHKNARSWLTWNALIWQYWNTVVKSYGGGVYRCSRLLENMAKEMGYIALRDKPEKEAISLGKKTSLCPTVLTRWGAVLIVYTCSSLQIVSNSIVSTISCQRSRSMSRANFNNTKEQNNEN